MWKVREDALCKMHKIYHQVSNIKYEIIPTSPNFMQFYLRGFFSSLLLWEFDRKGLGSKIE